MVADERSTPLPVIASWPGQKARSTTIHYLLGSIVSLLKLIRYGFVSVGLGLIMWSVLKPVEFRGEQHEINLDAVRAAGL